MRMRSEQEINELVELARAYYEKRAAYYYAKAEGRLSMEDDDSVCRSLAILDLKLELLKSNNELDRRRARMRTNVVSLKNYRRKAVK